MLFPGYVRVSGANEHISSDDGAGDAWGGRRGWLGIQGKQRGLQAGLLGWEGGARDFGSGDSEAVIDRGG